MFRIEHNETGSDSIPTLPMTVIFVPGRVLLAARATSNHFIYRQSCVQTEENYKGHFDLHCENFSKKTLS